MTEGIEYQPTGTIDVTFDDKTYHLGRPKFGQFKYFTRMIEEARQEVRDKLEDATSAYNEAKEAYEARPSPEARVLMEKHAAEIAAISRAPFYEYTVAVLAEMFSELGDPLPENPDDWPSWLAADISIPNAILKQWRDRPKASGVEPTP